MRSEPRITPIVGSHLSDDQLMETYVLAGENPHLAMCLPCKARFDDLVRMLEHVREEALREADQVLTAERLHHQRNLIVRRLERQGHPADVVLFPTRASGHPVVRVLGPARRWVAAAAAAGMAAGLFLGFSVDRRTHYAAIAPALQTTATSTAWQAAIATDDQFFSEIDAALLGSSRVVELRAIDAMTTPVEIREASHPR